MSNIPECAWMWLYKQDSEYASGPKYAKILNMAKFWIWQGCQYANITQRSEYARICLGKILNVSSVLNMPGFWIWQGSEYATILNMPQCGWICLNRTWICMNMSEFTIIGSIIVIGSKMERFGKIIILFNYFCKKPNLKSLRGFWICVGF